VIQLSVHCTPETLVGNVRCSSTPPVAAVSRVRVVSGGMGVDSNDTFVLLGDGSHGVVSFRATDRMVDGPRESFGRPGMSHDRWPDRLLIKPSGQAEPAPPLALVGHINSKASADLRSRVSQESRRQLRQHHTYQRSRVS
jgi:hypothetical protein